MDGVGGKGMVNYQTLYVTLFYIVSLGLSNVNIVIKPVSYILLTHHYVCPYVRMYVQCLGAVCGCGGESGVWKKLAPYGYHC